MVYNCLYYTYLGRRRKKRSLFGTGGGTGYMYGSSGSIGGSSTVRPNVAPFDIDQFVANLSNWYEGGFDFANFTREKGWQLDNTTFKECSFKEIKCNLSTVSSLSYWSV